MHLVACLVALSLALMELLFDFLSASDDMRHLKSNCGWAVVTSGFVLKALMKQKYAVSSQRLWELMLSRKFIGSLMLTNLTDRFATILFGEYQYDGAIVLSTEVSYFVQVVKLIAILGLYAYSVAVRGFREEQGNFQDSPGFSKLLDGMMKNLS